MAKENPDYASSLGTPEYEKYIAAQKRIEELLAQRENQLFDPTMLAMAQGFLAPTKTGTFGETLGNVAGAVAPVQANEEKRAMDMAKIRSEMAQQELGMSMQINQQNKQNAFLDQNMVGGPPTAPSATPQQASPKPPQGAMPAGLPVAPTPIANAPNEAPLKEPMAFPIKEQTPPSAQMPSGEPAPSPAPIVARAPAPAPQSPPPQNQGGYNFTKAERNMLDIGMRQGKSLPDMIKQIDEMRNNKNVYRENYFVNRDTNEVTPINTGEQTNITLHGEPGPRPVFKSDAIKLSNAASSENWDEYRKIADRIKYGPTPPPPSGGAGAPAPAPRVAAPLNADIEAEKARKISEGTQVGTGSGKRTSEAVDKYAAAVDTKNSAIAVKELINQEGGNLVVGVFAKPEIKAALLGMIEKNQFDPGSLSEAYTKLNVKYNVARNKDESNQDYTERKQAIIDRAQVAFSQMAQLQFQASLLAKGQGNISNNERTLFADTTISKGDSIGSLNKKADMLIKRADFAKAISNELTSKNIMLDQFRNTDKYKEMEKAYENDLRDILNPNRNKGRGHNAPAGHDDHKAARDRANALLGG